MEFPKWEVEKGLVFLTFRCCNNFAIEKDFLKLKHKRKNKERKNNNNNEKIATRQEIIGVCVKGGGIHSVLIITILGITNNLL